MDELKRTYKGRRADHARVVGAKGGFVKDVIANLPDPKPAYNTVSTILRILETKGFVAHESFGKSHRYFPKISKEDYKKLITGKLLHNYFGNSAKSMLSFFLEEKKMDVNELDEIMQIINKNR